MVIKVLNENTVYKRGILAEHGMSVLIEYEDKRILFDTGQSDVFMRNAKKMGADLSNLDAIVLSHGHYDHCGGLEYFAQEYKLPKVYIRENAFENKKAKNEGVESYREIGIPWRNSNCMDVIKEHIVYTDAFVQIFENVYILGNIPYVTEFEKTNAAMKIDRDGELIDDVMSDEQILVIRSDKGLHVFAGCSHPGIINVLRLVADKFPGEHIFSLYAGMHLISAADVRIRQVIEEIAKLNIDLIIPAHCTGQNAAAAVKSHFKERCRLAVASDIIEI